jgi:hypothetical protein
MGNSLLSMIDFTLIDVCESRVDQNAHREEDPPIHPIQIDVH